MPKTNRDSKVRGRSNRRQRATFRYGTKVEHEGKTRTIKDWAQVTSVAISPKLICSRLNRGWLFITALTTLPKPRRRKLHYLSFQGNSKLISEWSKEVNKPQKTIERELKEGKSIEEALGFNQRRRKQINSEVATLERTPIEDKTWWVVYTGKHTEEGIVIPAEQDKGMFWSWKVIIISEPLPFGDMFSTLQCVKLQSDRPDLLLGGGVMGPCTRREALNHARLMRPDIYK